MKRKSGNVLVLILVVALTLVGCDLVSVVGVSKGNLAIKLITVDEEGVGVGGAVVQIDSATIGVTGEDGRFNHPNVRKGAKVRVQKDGWYFDSDSNTVKEDNQSIWFVGTREKSQTYSVSGKVVDMSGEGIPSVIITFVGTETVTAVTNAEGEFNRSGLKGSVVITAEKDGYDISRIFTVNGPDSNLTFVGTETVSASYSVSGVARSAGGLAIRGVIVSFEDEVGRIQTVLSGSDGSFSIFGLSGRIEATAFLNGWKFTPITRVVEGADFSLDFFGTPSSETAYTTSGMILIDGGAKDGQPLGAVLLRFELLDFPGSEDLFTITDPTGLWMMDGLIGRVRITPTKEGYSFSPGSSIIDKAMQSVGFLASQ